MDETPRPRGYARGIGKYKGMKLRQVRTANSDLDALTFMAGDRSR